MNTQEEPLAHVQIGNQEVTLLGTAHISHASVLKVKELLSSGVFDAVAIELCPSRYNAMVNPHAIGEMDLFQVLREGKTTMVIANLALSAYQQRLADEFGISPGAEMRAAIEMAEQSDLPVLLIDREVTTTMKRVYRNIPWWQKWNLLSGLLVSIVSREKVSEDEIEKLKEGDVLDATLSQFADSQKGLFKPLISERDQFMALRLQQELEQSGYHKILAVVGAGHLKGINSYLEQSPADANEINAQLSELNIVPRGSRWPKVIPWLIVIVILAGFSLGFYRSPDLGWRLVSEWVVINGGLSAFGAAIALGHPLTVLIAFLAAPLTSLNPMVGAGMVTAAAEIYLRKPNVGDFGRLRKDVTHLKGWWKNRVARVLLVFLFSTLGSAIGTYLAGFRIIERLT